ncbi:hypothetical protein GCM10009646_78520 [Streptomyces aureus]
MGMGVARQPPHPLQPGSAAPDGTPWSERTAYVWWDGADGKSHGPDMPHFVPARSPGFVADEDAARAPAKADNKMSGSRSDSEHGRHRGSHGEQRLVPRADFDSHYGHRSSRHRRRPPGTSPATSSIGGLAGAGSAIATGAQFMGRTTPATATQVSSLAAVSIRMPPQGLDGDEFSDLFTEGQQP